VTYNKINTYDWYRQRSYKVEEEPDYDRTNRDHVWAKAQEWGDRIPIGILYEDTERPTYEEQVSALKKGPLVHQPLDGRTADYEALKLEFV
jgi:2-oxoglutarate ferredoxin oxidoreductase subunit beta